MKWTTIGLLVIALAIVAGRDARAFVVDLSMNVFPTNLANPNGGGTWRMVAKTDAPLGIAGISAWLTNVSATGLAVEPDLNSILNSNGDPINGAFGAFHNILYGQNIAVAPVLVGVGTPSFSDGPDPLGNPFWDGATRIFSGNYPGLVPAIGTSGNAKTVATTLQSTSPLVPALEATVTTVVRVQVPEPAAASLAAVALGAAVCVTRRRARSRP